MSMQEYLEKIVESDQQVNPFFRFLGVDIKVISPEETIFQLPAKNDFVQGAGVVAGGVQAALLDEVMAHQVLTLLEPGQSTATVELSVRYFRPVQARGTITATARCIRRGKSIVAVEADLTDHAGVLCARAMASFIVQKKK